jgi:hypothetical protein
MVCEAGARVKPLFGAAKPWRAEQRKEARGKRKEERVQRTLGARTRLRKKNAGR